MNHSPVDRSRDFRTEPPTPELAQQLNPPPDAAADNNPIGQPDPPSQNPPPPVAKRNIGEATVPHLDLFPAISQVSEAFRHIAEPKKRLFAAAMALMGTATKAAAAVGISLGTPYSRQWREDAELQAALELAEEMYGHVLEAEIDRRAVEGVWKPTGWYKGAPGGYVREYSDLLLIFRAKGLMREKYGDQVRLTGAFANLDVSKLTNDQVSRLAAGEHPASVLGPGLGPQRLLPGPKPGPGPDGSVSG